ncbi:MULTISPECIES: MOSC and FAD-binding oxidoreductase domain-containing protein [unclassified Rhizobium]|uniref:MOSC and FAD-binding oxidoreductase domain-containing protein n=1 Tax=unclassified Rhizobium TaxID=2613769 RepID=UPI001A996DFE|nr:MULTISPECIES: MOSC and FAD-binding oxidoreductase domain-containing protein [unclassified Rhizobium]MBX5156097.1 MOSC domain-containing protein [Rhizobium sp. NZLR8]MBX5164428.1 MOSC domain-containing protein [Rhizobium sp. NZLR4b]MBX5174142.1 MOSC domain-containing protein [Rhizobium sp. NZLR1b]MBX5193204.1 MOSC domain-containing protein [Rhizobium sp. NZLR3b]MBX5201979.1 MOSC domain-containing protein [Rhizobium sp. NZLR1]
MVRLLSVNVGLPRDITWQGKIVNTAIWKTPVDGPRMVRRLNVDGDGQADLAGHGGEGRAVFVYQIDSYRYWQEQLRRDDFVYGQFGENFTIDGLPDAEVCIGDRYRIGAALFEVTQPRVTCYRLGIRMDEPQMAALLVKHGRPGFYLRVLEEGDVRAGDEITKVASGPEGMSIFAINALLYMPGHPRDQLERALRIPALSAGWRGSFEALLKQRREEGATTGNAGLAAASGPPPAWRGFRPMRVSRKVRESGNVTSLLLEPTDGQPVTAALPGQFVVLRFGPASAPAMMRSYSLSGEPSASHYRVSVKREPHGLAGCYIDDELQIGDIVQASAARGSFTLRPGASPIVLLSAGIGVTPVLAMLHVLAAEASTRQVWWLYATRNGREHPFAEEARGLLGTLAHHRSHIRYSLPDPEDRPKLDFDAYGRLDVQSLRALDLPRDCDVYICGPSTFMSDLTVGLIALGIAPDRIHSEMFGAGPSITPGMSASPPRPPHSPAGSPGSGPLVSFARTGLNVRWEPTFQSLLELAEACDVPVRWSCRTGVCHTCETGLVAGSVDYRPDPVDAPADGNVLICCSKPKGDIVIDL